MEQQFNSADIASSLGTEDVKYLGTGSYGESWLAPVNGNERAIKIFHKAGYSIDRLNREIAGHRRVNHDNVVKLYDAYLLTVAGLDRVAMEFEYIDGGALSAAIASGDRPTSEQLRGLATGLLNGVEALHKANLLHRDLKPDNVALRGKAYEQPVILDLGLAKLLDIESITRYPSHMGTIMYMAPEQLRSERALKASDLWAVGVILYEAATGRHPFFTEGESMALDEAIARLQTPPSMPDSLPADIAKLISKCLIDPAYRRGTVAKALAILN